jgi:hypothetical protein
VERVAGLFKQGPCVKVGGSQVQLLSMVGQANPRLFTIVLVRPGGG